MPASTVTGTAAIGATYAYVSRWKLRMGVIYDQSRVPDAMVDFAYTHIFMKNSPIDDNLGSTTVYGNLLGSYKNSVDILGVQYSAAY